MIYITDEDLADRFGGRELFKEYAAKVEVFFKDAPLACKRFYGVLPFRNDLQEYLIGLYLWFYKIYKTELPENAAKDSGEEFDFEKAAKFVKAIYFRKVRQGSKINRYVVGVSLPPYVKRLVRSKNNNYYLLNSDRDSLEYKLALLSVIDFDGEGEKMQIRQKLPYWEQVNNIWEE